MLFPQNILVIDYGTRNIKGLLYQAGPAGRKILRAESLPIIRLEQEEVAEGQERINEYEYNLVRFVQSFFPEETSYVLNLPLSKVFVRDISMPVVPEKQFREVMAFEVENYLPISLEEAEVIGKSWAVEEDQASALTFTSPNENLSQAVLPLLRSQGSVRMLSLDCVGLASVVGILPPEDIKDRVIAQIDIGCEYTIFNVIQNGELVFTRHISVGGLAVDWMLKDELGLDIYQAEQRKLSLDLDIGPDQLQIERSDRYFKNNKITREQLVDLTSRTRAVYAEILEEIERSILSLKVPGPGRIYISGGGALMRGAADFFSSALGIKVEPYPLQLVGGTEPLPVALWATALGTGEHYRNKPQQRLDYLNSPFGRTLRKGEFNLNVFAMPLFLGFGALIVFLVSFLISILLDRRQIAAFKSQINAVARDIPGLSVTQGGDVVAQARRLCVKRLKSNQAQSGGGRVLDILSDLTARTPPREEINFVLKSFNYQEKDLEAKIEAEVDDFPFVATIQNKYQESKLYKKVEVEQRTKLPQGKIKMNLKLNLKDSGAGAGRKCK
ncbi:MAG: pilus assembly protein PilM [Spirochaetales bacterium]|nr:pilus assembly protein PilM [Spirochaetales bacterium]